MMQCKKCGTEVRSFSPMRKWCTDCRKKIAVERAREKRIKKK